MAKRYETGTKRRVLEEMLECATRDREAYVDAIKGGFRHQPPDDEAQKEIDEARALIRDFKKFGEAYSG